MRGYYSSVLKIKKYLRLIQNVFGTAPINQQFIDQSTGGNDVIYKNVQIGETFADGGYLDTKKTIEQGDIITLIGRLKSIDGHDKVIFGSSTSNGKLIASVKFNHKWEVGNCNILREGSDADTVLHTFQVKEGDGLYIDGMQNIDTSDRIFQSDATTVKISALQTGSFSGDLFLHYYKHEDSLGNTKCEYTFQSSDDAIEVDISGNNGHGEWIGDLEKIKANHIGGIDSTLINRGYSRFEKTIDNTKIITAAYDENGQPTLLSYAGYNAPVEVPKNIISDNKILIDGIQIEAIKDNASYNDISSLENTAFIEIDKDVKAVYNLIVKGDVVNVKLINEPIKLLIIGSSFSEDTCRRLGEIVESYGNRIIIGNTVIGGGTFTSYWSRIQANMGVSYNRWVNGQWLDGELGGANNALMFDVLQDQEWDFIVMQQSAHKGDEESSFQPDMNNVKDYMEANSLSDNPIFAINRTWAFAESYVIPAPFAIGWDDNWDTYGATGLQKQEGMHTALISAYDAAVISSGIDIIIPTGSAIQSARGTTLNAESIDNLTKDTLHLDRGIGRYIAAGVVFEKLIAPIINKTFIGNIVRVPAFGDAGAVTDANALLCQQQAINAVANF